MTELKSADELKKYTQKNKEEMEAVEEKKRKDQLDSNFRVCLEDIKKTADQGEFRLNFGKELSQVDQNVLRDKNYKVEYWEEDYGKFNFYWGYAISWN